VGRESRRVGAAGIVINRWQEKKNTMEGGVRGEERTSKGKGSPREIMEDLWGESGELEKG